MTWIYGYEWHRFSCERLAAHEDLPSSALRPRGFDKHAIVSWNFKHIVRLDRINAYNDVNERRGFRRLTIVTPLEVVHGIDEENQEDV